MNGVQDVEEVLARRGLALRIFVREELDELSIFLELRIECLNAELIIVGYLYRHDLGLAQQLLLVG